MHLPGPRGRRAPYHPGPHRVAVGGIVQTSEEAFQEVTRLDALWNGLRSSVCGSARGICDTNNRTARALGRAWVEQFEARVGEFRNWRDEQRSGALSGVLWNQIGFNASASAWQEEAEALGRDVAAATGERSPVPSPPRSREPGAGFSWAPVLTLAGLAVVGLYLYGQRNAGPSGASA